MNFKISEIKGLSRENMLGKFTLPIAVFLLSEVIVMLVTSPFQTMLYRATENTDVRQILIAAVGEFIIMLIAILFGAGLTQIHLNIARRKPATFKDFAYPFQNHPDKFMGFGLLMVLISAACSLPGSICLGIGSALSDGVKNATTYMPLIIVGFVLLVIGIILAIIFAFGFALTTFILLDDPYDTRVIGAMKQSWKYMKGRKRKLFLLSLSFIGLFCLGILSFGLGFLWIEQYYLQSQTVFYLKVRAEHMEYHEILNGTDVVE